MAERDYEAFKTVFDEAYEEYIESLRLSNQQQYQKELQEKRQVYLRIHCELVMQDSRQA